MKEELPKRLLILGSTAVFLVLGVIGVSNSRDIAARYGNIQIPVAWYLVPIVLAVLVAASALLLPAAVLRWRRGVVVAVLFLVTFMLGATSPLLYALYDFEHSLSSPDGTSHSPEDLIKTNQEIKTFLNYFFVADYALKEERSEEFIRDGQYVADLSIENAPNNCNQSKFYCLAYIPWFEIVTKNGLKVLEDLEPDSFVDLLDLKAKKVQRVASIGTTGAIYGTNWVSEVAFTVYGLEEDAGFVMIIDLAENKETHYSINMKFRKQGANPDTFLIEKYGQDQALTKR